MDLGELPEGWVSWEIDPIQPGARKTLDELMVGRGRFARTIASRRLIELPAGNSLRCKMFGGQIRGAYGLFNRGDLGWVTGGYTADCVIELPAFAPVGLSTRVSGIDEVREILSEIRESLAVTYFPREIVDPGGSTIAGRAELKIVD